MKRLAILLIITICAVEQSTAQTALKLGLNLASISQNDYSYTKNTRAVFYQLGLGTKLKLDEPGFRAEFLFSIKGRKYEYDKTSETTTGYYQFVTEHTDRIPYFEMPLLFTIPVVKEKVVLEAGPTMAIRLGGKRTISSSKVVVYNSSSDITQTHNYAETEYKYNDEKAFPNNREHQPEYEESKISKNMVTRYDLGLNIGAQIILTPNIGAVVRYNIGLIDVFNDNYYNVRSQFPSYDANRNLELSINFFVGG